MKSSQQNRTQKQNKKTSKKQAKYSRPEVYDFKINRMKIYGNSQDPIPERITFVHFAGNDFSKDLLFIDRIPIPDEAWTYDKHDRILRWKGLFGGGQLHIFRGKPGAIGNIGSPTKPVAVTGGSRAQFLCSVALDCGADYIYSGGVATGLAWDTNSPEWVNAEWVKDRLLLTYTVTQSDPMLPPSFTFEFEDQETCAKAWDPSEGSFNASLALGEQDDLMVWDLVFKSAAIPMPDKGLHKPTGPDSVYPYWLQAVEDSAAYSINGAMEIDDPAPNGTLVGIDGLRAMSQATGYYRASAQSAPFGVFDGQMVINGNRVASSFMHGKKLCWDKLDPAYQEKTGLPAKGCLVFRRDGNVAVDSKNKLRINRLTAHSSIEAISTNRELHEDIYTNSESLSQYLATNSLSITTLTSMTPYRKDSDGNWEDVVQASVMKDFYTIMSSLIPDDQWDLVFPNTSKPVLTDELSEVANSPVSGVDDPIAWYQSLGTAVLTQQIASGTDKNCQKLNGPRAVAWLKQEVANSPVYHTHGQELFQYEWGELYSETNDFLNDQIINAAAYKPQINDKRNDAIEDINENVIADNNSPQDLKQGLIDEVNDAADYALNNNLYWAFAFYVYNTSPAILANIAIQLNITTGSTDGTALSRLLQTNITLLTALDPSGFFARQYNSTLNTFLATNILPSMYGFTGDADNFDIIYDYFKVFVDNNLDNADEAIAKAAAEINQMMQDEEFDEMLQASIQTIDAIAATIQETMSLPYVSEKFLAWFETSYPKFYKTGKVFSGLFICALGGLAMFNLIKSYKNWDDLSDEEKSEIVYATVQLGLQVVSAIVKRTVRICSIFTIDGMTAMQRIGAISKIAFKGETEVLNEGLMNISNSTARWLGDTAGATEMGEEISLLMNVGANDVRRVSWTEKIFGKNLDEFVSTRIGPVLILASIGLSIYFATQADSVISLFSDIANIIAGALMLFAMVGQWAISGGIIAAEGIMSYFIAAAGPLAIIAALAGVALMIATMFIKKPDPVEEFVDEYAGPAGFAVKSKCSAIDYAFHYANPDKSNLMMMGIKITTCLKEALSLCCNSNGSIGGKSATDLPDCVWQVTTDGLGMSQIQTVAMPEGDTMPVPLYLSFMSDNSISFQAKMSTSDTQSQDAPTIISQTWLSTPKDDADLTSDKNYLASLNITLQPVKPDANGVYDPQNAFGYMSFNGNGVQWVSKTTDNSTLFCLSMSGIAPNFMTMHSVNFITGTIPSAQETYGPMFGVMPSTPMTYANSGNPLPAFLTFSTQTGCYTPTGHDKALPEGTTNNTLNAKNTLGNESVDFSIVIAKTIQQS